MQNPTIEVKNYKKVEAYDKVAVERQVDCYMAVVNRIIQVHRAIVEQIQWLVGKNKDYGVVVKMTQELVEEN